MFKITSIIITRNSLDYLKEAIKSVLNQTLTCDEIIVVDNNSNDGTEKYLKTKKQIKYIKLDKNYGIGYPRNIGVKASKNNILCFLDSDDLWLPNKNEVQINEFRKNPNLDIVFGQVINFFDKKADQKKYQNVIDTPRSGFLASGLMVKKSSFIRTGFFDTSLEVGEFIDWFLKAKQKNMKFKILDQLVFKRRIHGLNNGILKKDKNTDYIKVIRRYKNKN